MGLSDNTHHHLDGKFSETTEGKKFVITGISLRSPKKPKISLSSSALDNTKDEDLLCPTTPTAASFRIPKAFTCPPAPKKRKTSLKFSYGGGAREFFSPPDLETVFIHRTT
ncbi:PREDICTED: uncharacterized protein LOC104787094 [Camelina sativa]|uniref:Uncharacterized protein LOC104787094 n=1 Tax=Camelina sativa TaxID=90675 RepID=A0ABM0Z607_CAMSA|nr:PREDICTED: uncharacterized protein LOC104787094 [Camelina sativa]